MVPFRTSAKKCTSCIFLCVLLFAPTSAISGAWNQPEGEGQVVTTGRYYQTDRFKDSNGNSQSQPEYSKYEFEPHIEYGLTDWLTVGSSARAAYISQQMGLPTSNYGLGDSEFFARIPVWKSGSAVISVQPLVKLPSAWQIYDRPTIGRSGWDAEMKIAAGYGFSLFGHNDYIDAAIAYRSRFGGVGEQLRYELTMAVNPWEELGFIGQFFYTEAINDISTSLGSISLEQDYSLAVAQISALYTINEDYKLQFGGFSHLDGKNTGEGDGLMLGWWLRF